MYLQTKKYRSFCGQDFVPDISTPPPSGSIYVQMEDVDKFFKVCEETDNKYVMVSADSDYGLAYQQEHPVWKDLKKWTKNLLYMGKDIIDFETFGYQALTIPPRCLVERCSLEHKYSLKCETHTMLTFPDIPGNIQKWFATNCMVRHPLVDCIPFGVHPGVEEVLATTKIPEKEKWLYVNFQTYTLSRYFLKQYLYGIAKDNQDWMTFVLQNTKPLEEYLQDIAEHRFTLCPNGNGVDCFRTWEALHLGSIPIVEKNVTTSYFEDLPIVVVEDIERVDLNFLEKKYDEIKSKDWNKDKLDMNYWKHKIKETQDEIDY